MQTDKGQTTSFLYPNYDPTNGIVQLKYVVDGDGRTNTVSYLPDDIYYKNRVGSVTDPFGRTASFGRAGYFDGLGNVMTNITDVAGISSAFSYDGMTRWPTNLTTPYGNTSFEMVSWGEDVERSIIIREPGGAGQAYIFWELCTNVGSPFYVPPAYPASQVPTNTPIGTLDNKPDVRNSFYWGRQQYATLPQSFKDTGDFSLLSTNDYLKARLRHWLPTARSTLKTEVTFTMVRGT